MDIKRSVVRLFSARIGSQFIGFLGLMYFARELGAEQIGIFFLFQASLSILTVPADMGVQEGIEKRISEGSNAGKILTTGLVLKLAFSTVLSIGLFITKDAINNYMGGQVTLLLIIALFLNSISEVAIRTLRGELRVGETASLQFIRQAIWVGIGALFVWRGFGYLGLIYSLILGFGTVFLWGMSKSSTKLGPVSWKHATSLWTYSKYSFIGAVGGSFYSWMDVAVIGLFLPQTHVGAYEMAWRIGVVVTLFSSTIATTIFPQVSEWKADEDRKRIESLLSNAITPSLLFVIPAFFGSILLSREILSLLFGPEFVLAWLTLIIFMLINFVQAITEIFSRALRAIDHPELVAKARTISLSLNIILNFLLIWRFGITGAAIATGVALTVYTLLVLSYLRPYVRIEFPYYEVTWCMIAGIGMAIAVRGVQSLIVINSLPMLFAVVGIGAVIYFCLIMIYPPLRIKALNNTSYFLKNM
ncbi:flippase [Natronosalvus rutilus]|uniref:Flippase n=1 Tax=Natronosalvus rutilus TaxID=2953753 RepID=A0A9E7NC92_9EURY|nr:flippase [Natronosalvus rutilus]UTF54796.1 flippase [Natronosalvus rutilus]